MMRVPLIALALDILAASALIALGLWDSRRKWDKSAWPAEYMIMSHRSKGEGR